MNSKNIKHIQHYIINTINRRLQIFKIEVDNKKLNPGDKNFVQTNRNALANNLDHDE